MANRRNNLKQVWISDGDLITLDKVGAAMEARGLDVLSDHRLSKTRYSPSKVFSILLNKESDTP